MEAEIRVHKFSKDASLEDILDYIKQTIENGMNDSDCCGECDNETESGFPFEYALQAMRNGLAVSHTATEYDFFIKSDKLFKFDPRTMKVEPASFWQDDIMSNEWYVVE